MAGLLTPDIGASGVYTLKEPFQDLLVQGKKYTCRAIRTIDDIVASGLDPYSTYYAPGGTPIARSIYDADVAAGMVIVSLQSSSGDMVYIPNTYILSFPATGGVPYAIMCLAASLEAIPESVDLSVLKAGIVSLITDTIGVNATVQEVKLSQTELIDSTISANMEAARQLNISNRTTDRAKLLALQTQYAQLQQHVTTLENYIRDHLAPAPAPAPAPSP